MRLLFYISSMRAGGAERVMSVLCNGFAERGNDVYLATNTHLLMENVFEWMKNNGVRFYDMGRIGPGRKNSNSVYEFKKYSGGDFVQYNGEWIYVRKRWVEYLLAYIVKERW